MRIQPSWFLLLAACGQAAEEAETRSFTGPTLEVFMLQARIFCPTADPNCGHIDQASLINAYYLSVNEMNLQYIPTGISFHALPPIITVDDRFSTMSGPGDLAGNGEPNDLLQQLLTIEASETPDRITMILAPNFKKCWNGIPCPGEDDDFDGDDMIWCYPPPVTQPEALGSTYAHEMGHYWCLRHTFSNADPTGPNSVDHNGDDESCDSLTNVLDTPSDPGTQEGSDVDSNNVTLPWKEWCGATSAPVDYGSPHQSSCTVECYQMINGTLTVTPYEPLTENAMSYYGFGCRGPYDRNNVRHEAFTSGQRFQIQECRYAVPMRLLLDDICSSDSDHDGLCDGDDLCPNLLDTRNGDYDGDGVGDPCDDCPGDPTGSAGNSDGDWWCNASDGCPQDYDQEPYDLDQDGLWASCDLCPLDWDPTNSNIDGDSEGDVCDDDIDNDGCLNDDDQHPQNLNVRVGFQLDINCNPSSSAKYGPENGDTDGDGLLDCEDFDDDDDGTPDDDDLCPVNDPNFCQYPGTTCPYNPIFFTCRTGGCNEYLIRLIAAINPDPTTQLIYEIDSVVDDKITIAVRSVPDAAAAVRGEWHARRGYSGPLKMEIIDARGNVILDVASYVGTSVETRNVTFGSRLEIALETETSPMMITGLR